MGTKRTGGRTGRLTEAHRGFTQWRRRRRRRERIPERLWRMAVDAALAGGVSVTARRLGLNRTQLQERLRAAEQQAPPEEQPCFFLGDTAWALFLRLDRKESDEYLEKRAPQMEIMRRLFESRRWQTLEPDQGVIVAGQQLGERHLQAARTADGKFLFVYLPWGDQVTVDMTKIKGQEAAAWWFNPRDGRADLIGRVPCRDTHDFLPPSQGVDNDWVLVLDDAAQEMRPPGSVGP